MSTSQRVLCFPKELVNTGLLQHIKGIERMPGSFADLLLSVKDPYTGAAVLFLLHVLFRYIKSNVAAQLAQACR